MKYGVKRIGNPKTVWVGPGRFETESYEEADKKRRQMIEMFPYINYVVCKIPESVA